MRGRTNINLSNSGSIGSEEVHTVITSYQPKVVANQRIGFMFLSIKSEVKKIVITEAYCKATSNLSSVHPDTYITMTYYKKNETNAKTMYLLQTNSSYNTNGEASYSGVYEIDCSEMNVDFTRDCYFSYTLNGSSSNTLTGYARLSMYFI